MYTACRTKQIRTEQNFIHVGKHVRSHTGGIRYIKTYINKKRETLNFSAFTNMQLRQNTFNYDMRYSNYLEFLIKNGKNFQILSFFDENN